MIRSRLMVTKATPVALRGLVTAEHPLGAEVGAKILMAGGNAVDAAVATAFAMTVVEPFMSTIAGAGTMLVHRARQGETIALDFNGCAPLQARPDMFSLAGGTSTALFAWPRVQGDANVYGPRSVAVPGSVAGLTYALERWGSMDLQDVAAPAIGLAREGFVPDWYQALTTAKYLEELKAFPESARTYLRDGRSISRPPTLEYGDRIAYPDLARSLELIARDGAEVFYNGAIADAIASHMKETGGLITKDDLASYRIRVGDPLASRYRDLEILWSPGATGGITAMEILNILGQFPRDRVGWETATGLHHRAQAIRRAFLDRFALLGDAEIIDHAPWARLASTEYARTIAADIRRGRDNGLEITPARGNFEAGGPPLSGDGVLTQGERGDVEAASRPLHHSDCTTHVCAVDRQRNMVALTHTAVSTFGSRMVVPGTGILLNNGMIWFDPEPGKPNSVGPGKRGMVNMVPALAFKRGRPYLAVGAPGGRRIISAVAQVIANLADGPASAQAAVEAPRVHAEGAALDVDSRVSEKARRELARRGYTLVEREETYAGSFFAKPIAIRITSRGLDAGLDHLRPAAAAGH
jgi:gamma-glutamyltranspeptidase / glutathione hydrolase